MTALYISNNIFSKDLNAVINDGVWRLESLCMLRFFILYFISFLFYFFKFFVVVFVLFCVCVYSVDLFWWPDGVHGTAFITEIKKKEKKMKIMMIKRWWWYHCPRYRHHLLSFFPLCYKCILCTLSGRCLCAKGRWLCAKKNVKNPLLPFPSWTICSW